MSGKRRIVLCILDGWGCSTGNCDDAIYLADTPCFDALMKTYPNCRLDTSSGAVGLPEGQAGNSEVGHAVLGCGRIIETDIMRINKLIASDTMRERLGGFFKQSCACHISGLLSDGGVHSHVEHIFHLIDIAARENKKVYVHCFTDGRDTGPRSAVKYIGELRDFIRNKNNVSIATISGRMYAMDRDNNWDRTQKAYNAIVWGRGEFFTDAECHIEKCYGRDLADEFIVPAVHIDYNGIAGDDGLIMANFRADRVRQILTCLADNKFNGFSAGKQFGSIMGMVEYSLELNKSADHILPSVSIKNTLGSVIADAGYKQLRISETEKYAHVTFFFNGGVEGRYRNEERIMIPSPKVLTYDLAPEMSSAQMTEKLRQAVAEYDFIVANYPGADMVGHTGNMPQTVKAIESIDKSLAVITEEALLHDAIVIIAADHGNAEKMMDRNTKFAAHTTNKTPCIIVGRDMIGKKMRDGSLKDVAPTILELMNINIPPEMTGGTLFN